MKAIFNCYREYEVYVNRRLHSNITYVFAALDIATEICEDNGWNPPEGYMNSNGRMTLVLSNGKYATKRCVLYCTEITYDHIEKVIRKAYEDLKKWEY